jgi:hypothetical protein
MPTVGFPVYTLEIVSAGGLGCRRSTAVSPSNVTWPVTSEPRVFISHKGAVDRKLIACNILGIGTAHVLPEVLLYPVVWSSRGLISVHRSNFRDFRDLLGMMDVTIHGSL